MRERSRKEEGTKADEIRTNIARDDEKRGIETGTDEENDIETERDREGEEDRGRA